MNQNHPLPDRNGINNSEKLSFSTKLAYGAGDVGAAITSSILTFYLSPFLTDVAGLKPELAGRTQLVGKVWDAVNDPMVGVLSDRTTSRWGRRYPWMIWGAVPFGICFILQWLIPNFGSGESRQWGLFWYYTLISILFNAFFTVINLPYTALTPELTKDYNERTSLNSFRFAFSIGSSILGAIIALIVFGQFASKSQAYLVIGLVCAVFAVLPTYWCVLGTRKRVAAVANKYPDAETPVRIPLASQIKIVLQNRPFLFVVGIYLCSWLSLQLTAVIIPYFVTSYMRLGDGDVSKVVLAVQGTALAMLFVWSAVSQRVGKKATYFMGMGIWIFAQSGLFFVQPEQVGLMYVLAILSGVGVSTAYLIPWSMLPDVVELDELETGQRREGIFYSFMVFVQKICLGLAVSFALEILGRTGYIQPTDGVYPEQGTAVLLTIRSFIGPIPTLFLILGLVLAYFYPITREFHTQLLLRLNERRNQVSESDER
jgi:GPH family glycoside/pentoside/hexuronide:cation symporter